MNSESIELKIFTDTIEDLTRNHNVCVTQDAHEHYNICYVDSITEDDVWYFYIGLDDSSEDEDEDEDVIINSGISIKLGLIESFNSEDLLITLKDRTYFQFVAIEKN